MCLLIVFSTAISLRLFQWLLLTSELSLRRLFRADRSTQTYPGRYYNFSNGEFRFYAYSAFYDDRRSLLSAPVVRIIAVSDQYSELQNSSKRLYCTLHHDERDVIVSMDAEPLIIGYGWPMNNVEAREYVYTCPAVKGMIPRSVSVTTDQAEYISSGIPVIVPRRPKSKRNFCVCVQAVYGSLNPYRLVEWMELQRILGVSLVGVYILSAPQVVLKVFGHYSDEKFVDLRRIDYIYSSEKKDDEFWLHLTPTINDCIYRHMHEFRRIVVVDFDEVIVPRKHRDLSQLVGYLEQLTDAPNFAFRNNYFFLDLAADRTVSKYIRFLRYRYKVAASGVGYAEKSIIDPQSCTNMHNHCCLGVTANYTATGNTASVEPDIALSQHYKKCHFSETECEEMMRNKTKDDVLMPFKEILIRKVEQKIKEIMGHGI